VKPIEDMVSNTSPKIDVEEETKNEVAASNEFEIVGNFKSTEELPSPNISSPDFTGTIRGNSSLKGKRAKSLIALELDEEAPDLDMEEVNPKDLKSIDYLIDKKYSSKNAVMCVGSRNIF